MTDQKLSSNESECKALVLHDVDGEPRIRDVDLGERLGMARPDKIRQLIERNRAELETYGPLAQHGTMVEIGSGARREVTEYDLNEPQSVLVCMKSNAPKAADVRREVIEVFMAYRHGQLSRVPPDSVVVTIDQLREVMRQEIEAKLLANPQHIAVGYLSALDIAKMHKIPAKGRRGIVISISAHMRRHCLKCGFQTRISAETGKYLFPPEAVDHWLLHGGFRVIHRHLSKVEGQGVLQLVPGGRSEDRPSP